MLAVIGTVPDPAFPLLEGEAGLEGDDLLVKGYKIKVNRGTPALIASVIKAQEVLGRQRPYVFLVGDTGLGRGSSRLYHHLSKTLSDKAFESLTFHYLQPDVDGHNLVLFAIEEMKTRPLLIADAGFMYVAKMSGQAEAYDLFTPDAGELAFLADEEAPHPFYTRGFILHEENRVADLVARAYENGNASRMLLVKGAVDVVADRMGILATVDDHTEEAMEAIGGTGDTLTGLAAAMASSGMDLEKAAVVAAKANRLAGCYARPIPSTQVVEIIKNIPRALEKILEQ